MDVLIYPTYILTCFKAQRYFRKATIAAIQGLNHLYVSVHPSSPHYLNSAGGVSGSVSQWMKAGNTPWTIHQSVTGHNHIVDSHTHTLSLQSASVLLYYCTGYCTVNVHIFGVQCLERPHEDIGRICNLHIERPWVQPRSQTQELLWATVGELTTAAVSYKWTSLWWDSTPWSALCVMLCKENTVLCIWKLRKTKNLFLIQSIGQKTVKSYDSF